MDTIKILPEPLRITNQGKYELYDYKSSALIAVSGALLLSNEKEPSLTATIKIIEKETNREFDRFKLMAFVNPSDPYKDRLEITGKFFNPQKHYLKIEPGNTRDEIHFLLYFSGK